MNNSSIILSTMMILLLALLVMGQNVGPNSDSNIIQQYNERIVLSHVEPVVPADDLLLLLKNQQGFVVTGSHPDFLTSFAADELVRYLRLSAGIDLGIKKDMEIGKEDLKSPLIVLGNANLNEFVKKLKIKLDAYNLGKDGYFIQLFKKPFDRDANALVIAGNDSKGILNGVYAFLNGAVSAEWFPPRIHRNYMEYFVDNSIYDAGYYRVRDENRFQIETYLESRERITWPEKALVVKPVAQDLGMIYDKLQFRKAVVDWSVKNKLNTIVVYVDINFPLHIDESNRIKQVVEYAHRYGVQVHFFTFTHVCSRESRQQFPEIHVTMNKSYKDKDEGTYVIDNPKTLEESTKLMVNLVQEYQIDGIGWHPASERIDRTIEEGKPKYFWETVYITAYDKAIKQVKPDAKLFFVLGWEYMNPPDELRKYLPTDIVAWIVPSRTWTRQYIDEYFANFSRIWFWLYPWYSTEGVFPDYKIERLQKTVQEGAANQILGIVPEMYGFRNHEMNLMSLTRFYFDPDTDAEQFKKEFNDKYYYHDSRGNAGFNSYVEGDYWGAYKLFADAYQASNNPMVRDRMKDMAISSLRLIEDAAADAETMYKTCLEAEKIFAEQYLSSEETDLFYIILQEVTEKWKKKITER